MIARRIWSHGRGGLEELARNVTVELGRQGHHVRVVTTAHPDGRRADEAYGARVHYLAGTPPGDYSAAWWRESRRWAGRALSEARTDVVLSISLAGYGLVGVPGARLCTLVSGLDLRLLHSHWQDARGAAGLGRFAMTALGTARRLPRWRRLLRASAAVVAMSADVAARLCRYRAHALSNFVDTASFAPDAVTRRRVRGELGLAEGDCAVVMVGAFTWQKGMHLGLDACADLARSRPSVVAVVAGDGPARAPVARGLTARAPHLRARLLGDTPHDAVGGLLAAGDVFLMPTLRQEAMPTLTMLEAMAAGLPVVTTRPTPAPTGVRDGESGAVVPPGDAAALARALAPLVDDVPRRRAMGAAARRLVADYDQAVVVRRLVDIIEAARPAS